MGEFALAVEPSRQLIDQLVHLGSRDVVLLLLCIQNVGESFDGAGKALYQRGQVIGQDLCRIGLV